MLRYISIFREKYNRYFITGFGYKLLNELIICKFTHGSALSSKLQLSSLELKYNFIMTFTLWLINHYLSRHVRSREAYC